jgi:hypothetical protein
MKRCDENNESSVKVASYCWWGIHLRHHHCLTAGFYRNLFEIYSIPRYYTPYTYLLTPLSRVRLEKQTSLQLVKKFPAFYGTRKFITPFTSARHLSLSWARSIHSIPPTSKFLKINLNVIVPSTPRSPQWSLSLRIPHQNPIHASPLPHPSYMPRPSYCYRFYHPHNSGWGVQIMELLIIITQRILAISYRRFGINHIQGSRNPIIPAHAAILLRDIERILFHFLIFILLSFTFAYSFIICLLFYIYLYLRLLLAGQNYISFFLAPECTTTSRDYAWPDNTHPLSRRLNCVTTIGAGLAVSHFAVSRGPRAFCNSLTPE